MIAQNNSKSNENGSAILLILVAAVLFTALAYAVVKSTNESSVVSKKDSLASAVSFINYPNAIIDAIEKLKLEKGIDATQVIFTKPDKFDALPENHARFAIFHNAGGGVVYSRTSSDIVTPGSSGEWVFNSNNEIDGVGVTSETPLASENSADIIAFLPDVRKEVCDQIHETLGAPKEYFVVAVSLANKEAVSLNVLTSVGAKISGDSNTGHTQGCFKLSNDRYAYYHVLVSR